MPKMTLVPVDHEPEFGGGYSLVPIDHNPFSADGMIDKARAQLASQPERLPTSYGNPAGDAAAMQSETFANPYVRGLIDSTASLPRRAIENSQHSLDTGTYDPGPTLEAAMLPMGTGAMAGVPIRAGEAVLGAGPIRAYHGSPHDFDRFDLSKIGTGEGAQAYGHGLYFAENEGVAKGYRDQITGSRHLTPDQLEEYFKPGNVLNGYGGRDKVLDFKRDGDNWAVKVQGLDAQGNSNGMRPRWHQTQPSPQEIAAITGQHPGRMYEVNINADPAHFLDWDKPLSEQGANVKSALQDIVDAEAAHRAKFNLYGPGKTGGAAYESAKLIPGGYRSPPEASNALLGRGIPGIKYLDQGSRSAGQGSSNYVVFNDKLVDIVRKYAAAGIALPPAIAAEYDQMKASQSPPNQARPYTAGLGL